MAAIIGCVPEVAIKNINLKFPAVKNGRETHQTEPRSGRVVNLDLILRHAL